jgi:hypothetical protein
MSTENEAPIKVIVEILALRARSITRQNASPIIHSRGRIS